jgi:hypothetical protein
VGALTFSYDSKGKTYYLFKKGRIFYFTRDEAAAKAKGAEPIDELPPGKTVVVNERTGLPILKNA